MDPDPGGLKTYGSDGFASGSATLIAKEADLIWFLPGVSPGVRHQVAGMAEGFLAHITAKARSTRNCSL